MFAKEAKGGVEVLVTVVPRSSKSEIVCEHGGRLKICLKSPPVNGAANKELIKLLSKKIGIPKGRILIDSGETGRHKVLRLEDMTLHEFESKISVCL